LALRSLQVKAERVIGNHDPFDRLLLAQAKAEEWILLSHDRNFDNYDEKCICKKYMIDSVLFRRKPSCKRSSFSYIVIDTDNKSIREVVKDNEETDELPADRKKSGWTCADRFDKILGKET